MTTQQELVEEIEGEIARLETMRLNDLRGYWALRWGSPPALRAVSLLRHMIAWRIQAAAFGGLDARTKSQLRGRTVPRPPGPPPGSHLVREYQGVMHRVEVGEGVYRYNGREFRNLTAVAKAITGTHWNGPAFFGLRPKVRA